MWLKKTVMLRWGILPTAEPQKFSPKVNSAFGHVQQIPERECIPFLTGGANAFQMDNELHSHPASPPTAKGAELLSLKTMRLRAASERCPIIPVTSLPPAVMRGIAIVLPCHRRQTVFWRANVFFLKP